MRFSSEHDAVASDLGAGYVVKTSCNYKKEADTQELRHNIKPINRSQHRRYQKCNEIRSLLVLSLILLSNSLLQLPCVISQTTRATEQDALTTKPETTPEIPIGTATSPLRAASSGSDSIKNESTESTDAADFGGPPASGDPMNGGSQVKLKPINFTLVDEIFEAVLSEDEVVKKWKFMDSQLQDGMKSILKMVFPQIVALSQDAKVSGDCSGGILKWILSLRNLRSWAIKMLDATGKPTAGIFEGSLNLFGNYRQCLNIRAPDEDEIEITERFEEYFRGQYCVIHLKPWMPIKKPFYHLNSTIEPLLRKNYKYYEKTLYDELADIAVAFNFIDIRLDLCVPSTCTVADIQRVADLLSKKVEMRSKVMRCDVAPRDGVTFISQIDRTTCYWVAIPLIMFSISLIATIIHGLCASSDNLAEHQDENNQTSDLRAATSKLMSTLDSLSFGGALRNRLASPISGVYQRNGFVSEDSDSEFGSNDRVSSGSCPSEGLPAFYLRKPLPLYGLRNVFIFWFLVMQMTVELKYQYLRESLILRDMIISYWPFQIIVNSVLLFDSIILVTAFTFSYTCMEASVKGLISYAVDKYVRMILPIVAMIAITIITPLIDIQSPVWRNFVEQQSLVCKSTGYIDLFFLQNFIPYDKICLPHTWLFCVEFQLIILSVPLILLLKKNFQATEDAVIIERGSLTMKDKSNLMRVVFSKLIQSKAGLLGIFITLAGIAVNFFMVYTNQLPPTWFHTFPDIAQKNFYFSHYLTKTWTHLSVFAIGLLAGHLCRCTLQLRSIKQSRSRQSSQRHGQQPSPAPSGSTGHSNLTSRHSVHGSTSPIMPPDTGNRLEGEQSVDTNQTRSSTCSNFGKISIQLVSLVCMAAIIFSTFTWSTKEGPTVLVAAAYDALSRFVWSLALVIIINHLCLVDEETNRYSSLARFFAHPLCTLMGRLSFLAYLLSPYIHTFVLAVEEQSLFPSLFLIFHVIVGNIVITYAISFILAIVIEQPTRRLVNRVIFGDKSRKQKINITSYRCDGFVPTLNQEKQIGN